MTYSAENGSFVIDKTYDSALLGRNRDYSIACRGKIFENSLNGSEIKIDYSLRRDTLRLAAKIVFVFGILLAITTIFFTLYSLIIGEYSLVFFISLFYPLIVLSAAYGWKIYRETEMQKLNDDIKELLQT